MASQMQRTRARVGVSAVFVGHAVISGSWASRVPAIKHSLHLSDAQLGVALLGVAGGTLAGGRLGGFIVARVGARAVVRVGLPLLGVALVLAGVAPNQAALTAALVAFGVLAAVVDVAMNIEAVLVERLGLRPLMSGFHGLWSAGLLAGALLGAAAAAAGVSPVAQFVVVAVAVAAISAPLLTRLPERAAAHTRGGRARTRWTLAVFVFGLMTFSSFFAEGVVISWSAVFLHDRAEASAAVAAIGFAGFSLGMTISRLTGDRWVAAFGPVRLVLTSTVLAATGLALALIFPVPVVVVLGLTLVGIGLGPVVPTIVSAIGGAGAGAIEGVVARVFTLGYVGGFTGPALIGVVAGWIGLRAALLIPLGLIIYIASASGRVATAPGGPSKA